MDAEKLFSIQNSLHNVGIAVDKLVEKGIVFDNRLNWIEGKVTVPLDYKTDHQYTAAAGVQTSGVMMEMVHNQHHLQSTINQHHLHNFSCV